MAVTARGVEREKLESVKCDSLTRFSVRQGRNTDFAKKRNRTDIEKGNTCDERDTERGEDDCVKKQGHELKEQGQQR